MVVPFGLSALRGRWHLLRDNARILVTYGLVAVTVAQFCYFSAVRYMQVAPALLIEFTAPAAVVVWMWLRHGQRPGPVTFVGAAIAAAGLVLVLDLVSGASLSLPGVLWALAAMVGATTHFVIAVRRHQRPAADGRWRRAASSSPPWRSGCSASSACCRCRRRRAEVTYAGATLPPWLVARAARRW